MPSPSSLDKTQKILDFLSISGEPKTALEVSKHVIGKRGTKKMVNPTLYSLLRDDKCSMKQTKPPTWFIKKNHKYVVIAGIIGAGKTTLAKHLSISLDGKGYYERVENNKILQNFYKDKNTHAFHLQIDLLTQRLEQQGKILKENISVFQDRSIYEDQIFIDMLVKDGIMTEDQNDTYKKMFSLSELLMKKPDLIIFLDVKPEIALKRIKDRGRKMEEDINIQYMTNLSNCYKIYFEEFEKLEKIPIIKKDWNKHFEPNESGLTYYKNKDFVDLNNEINKKIQ